MNRKRKPQQRQRTNRKIVRKSRGKRLGQHQLDVRVKRRDGCGIRRHFRLPLIAKIAGVTALLALAGFITSNALGRFLWNNPAYTLTEIEFETDGRMTRPIALEAAGVSTGVNVLALELEDIRDQLIALPQVKDATVVRVLPGELRISLKERHPIAWLDCPEQNIFPKVKAGGILLDDEGVALPCTQMRPEFVNFPSISARGLAAVKTGKPIDSDQVRCALELVKVSVAIFGDVGWEIVEIKLVNDYSLLARFNNHTKVTFKPSDIGRQVDDLRAIYEYSLQQGRLLLTVDLRPERNIPITYADSPTSLAVAESFGDEIPRAYPIIPFEKQEKPEQLDSLDPPPVQARRAIRALRSIPKAAASAPVGSPDADLSSILHRD